MKLARYNAYRCEYGCITGTVDVDDGVTPFMIKCKSVSRPDRPLRPELTGEDGECIGTAQSCFYPKSPLPPHIKINHEWYKPDQVEIDNNWHDNKSVVEHIKNGGLILRKRTDREPAYHAE